MTRRTLLLGLSTGAIAAIACLALVEVVLRVYAVVADDPLAAALNADPMAVQVEPHGSSGFRPKPGGRFEYYNGAEALINDMGFRGEAVSIPKPEGTFRVVLMGGSTTFGWGVDDDQTIDWYLGRILRERLPGRTVEVVNLAFDGYDSYQLFERFQSDGEALDPDALIINTGVNDVSYAWFRDIRDGDRRNLIYRSTLDRLRAEADRGGPSLWTRAKHRLFMARVPGWLVTELARSSIEQEVVDRPVPTPHWDLLDHFERNLERLAELGVSSGAQAVLFSTPPSSLLTRYEPDQPPLAHYWVIDARTTQVYRDSLDARMKQVVREAAAQSLPVRYVPHEPYPTTLFLDDAHLTPEGNLRMAEDLADVLVPMLDETANAKGNR